MPPLAAVRRFRGAVEYGTGRSAAVIGKNPPWFERQQPE